MSTVVAPGAGGSVEGTGNVGSWSGVVVVAGFVVVVTRDVLGRGAVDPGAVVGAAVVGAAVVGAAVVGGAVGGDVGGGDVVDDGGSTCAPADVAVAITNVTPSRQDRSRTRRVSQPRSVRLRMRSIFSPAWLASSPFSPRSAARSASASRLARSVSAEASTASTPSSMMRSA